MVVQMAENKIHGDPSAQQRQAAQKYEKALKSLPLQKLKAVAANAKRDALRGIAGEIAKRREAYEEFEKEISKLEKNTRNAVHSAMQHKGTRVDAAHGVAYKRLPMSLLKQVSGDTIKKLQDSISSRDKQTKAILAKELASRKESQNERFNDYIKSRVVPVAQKANGSHTNITNITNTLM